ncbi:MAG: outer membrane protein transport protein [bacterium]|nr:outer membrane protein transport protein [bacterium]
MKWYRKVCQALIWAWVLGWALWIVSPSQAVLLNRIGSTSSSSLGMAGAGEVTAFHPGAMNLALNPAGLVTVEEIEAYLGGINLWSDFTYIRHPRAGGGEFGAYEDMFQFPEIAVAWRIDEHWIVGAELWVPYGLAADLRPVPPDFYHNQAEIFVIQGSFGAAYQFTEDFSLGASLDLNYIDVEFHLPMMTPLGVMSPTNQGDGLDVGFSLGVLWTPDAWRFGIKYSPPVSIDVDGDSYLSALGLGRQAFETEVHVPQRVAAGVAYAFTDRWSVALEGQYTDYGKNNNLVLDYVSALPNKVLPLNWENVWGLHVGNSIKLTEKLTWEQGIGYLSYAAPDRDLLPAIPDAGGFSFDTGFKYDWNESVSTYLSFAYAGGDRDIGYNPTRKAPGEMEADLFLIGLGLQYKF